MIKPPEIPTWLWLLGLIFFLFISIRLETQIDDLGEAICQQHNLSFQEYSNGIITCNIEIEKDKGCWDYTWVNLDETTPFESNLMIQLPSSDGFCKRIEDYSMKDYNKFLEEK